MAQGHLSPIFVHIFRRLKGDVESVAAVPLGPLEQVSVVEDFLTDP